MDWRWHRICLDIGHLLRTKTRGLAVGDIMGSAVRSFVATCGAGLMVLAGLVCGFVYITFRMS